MYIQLFHHSDAYPA